MELTERDISDAQKIMAFFWGTSAGNWKVNKKVLELLGEMLAKEGNCSKAMDFVPRPSSSVNASYIKRQLKGIARRMSSGDQSYHACKVAVAFKYKDRVKIASEGLW